MRAKSFFRLFALGHTENLDEIHFFYSLSWLVCVCASSSSTSDRIMYISNKWMHMHKKFRGKIWKSNGDADEDDGHIRESCYNKKSGSYYIWYDDYHDVPMIIGAVVVQKMLYFSSARKIVLESLVVVNFTLHCLASPFINKIFVQHPKNKINVYIFFSGARVKKIYAPQRNHHDHQERHLNNANIIPCGGSQLTVLRVNILSEEEGKISRWRINESCIYTF